MVHSVSAGHGANTVLSGIQPSDPYAPSIVELGQLPDTFEVQEQTYESIRDKALKGNSHGHGHNAPHGNFLQRSWHQVKTIAWDAVTLPVTMWNHFWYGPHSEDHDDHEPFLKPEGILSGNLQDERLQPVPGNNPFLAQKGYLSADLRDESMGENY